MSLEQNKLNQLYNEKYKPCVGYVLTNNGNQSDADDNYQNTWLVLLAALDKGKEIRDIGGFLWGTNKFLWQQHLRKKKKGDFD